MTHFEVLTGIQFWLSLTFAFTFNNYQAIKATEAAGLNFHLNC